MSRKTYLILAMLAALGLAFCLASEFDIVDAWTTHVHTILLPPTPATLNQLQTDVWDGNPASAVPTTTTRLRTHAFLTAKMIELYEANEGVLPAYLKQAMIFGSVAEDWDAADSSDVPAYSNLSLGSPTYAVWPAPNVNRCENHYYAGRPTGIPDTTGPDTVDRELNYDALLVDVDQARNTSAPRWAAGDVPAGSSNSFNWTDAIAGTGSLDTPYKRFRALGHVLHLLEDMVSPGHVRNDNHLAGDVHEKCLGRLTYDQHFMGSYSFAMPDTLQPLPAGAGVDNIGPFFYELAEHVQENYWSSRTIAQTVRNGIQLRAVSYQNDLFQEGWQYYIRNSAGQRIAGVTLAGFILRNQSAGTMVAANTVAILLLGPEYATLNIREECVQDCWADVAPRAIRYGASLIKLFVDDTGIAPPGPFNLASPASGSTGVSLTPTLEWTDSTAEVSYTLEIDTESSFSPPLTYQNTAIAGNATSFAVPGGILTGNTQYFWRVTAVNGLGSTTATNAPFNFTTVSGGGAWVELAGSATGGGISANAGSSHIPSLALDGSGYPVVAWDDYTSGNWEIYVKRWNGTSWVEVGTGSASGGGISANAGYSNVPSLALDGSGYPVVAWDDYTSGNWEIYVKRWNGTSWVEVGTGSASGGGISANAGASYGPSLALDGSGYPVVAWYDDTSGNWEIYVKRWNGTSWVEVGTGSASGGGISANAGASYGPSLALDGSGYPVVAWHDYTSGNREIYVKRWNGTSWVEVGTGSASGGGISANAGQSYVPSLALDGSGYPVVAWHDDTVGNFEIYVKRWEH